MGRKRKIKTQHCEFLNKGLNFTKLEKDYFQTLIQYQNSKNHEEKKLISSFLNDMNPGHEFKSKEVSEFIAISNWIYMAILAMTELKNFKGTEDEIYSLLDGKVNKSEIRSAIVRLLDLELLKWNSQNKLVATYNQITTKDDVKNEGAKEYHRQVLDLAKDAIDEQSLNEYEFQSFTMAIPKTAPSLPGIPGAPSPLPDRVIGNDNSFMDSTLIAADGAVSSLRDSLKLSRHQIKNLSTQVSLLKQKSVSLSDSVYSLNLDKNISQKNINMAMRHLSRSLRYFHSGDYREALQEVETALDLNPNLALAYARRGSIYYQLGDPQRATINWNLALQMDPEYDDVRNILKALHENRLKTTSFSRGEN